MSIVSKANIKAECQKVLVHLEKIKKKGSKLQFQIKLPRTAKKVIGLLVTANRTGTAIEGEPRDTKYAGWLRLRIPEKRDVFYADLIPFANAFEELLSRMSRLSIGIADQNEWWFGGTKREFFKVDIPIEDTIIEGYFEDHSLNNGQLYDLKVYVQLATDN